MRPIAVAVCLALAAAPAAADVAQAWVNQLALDGYDEITVRRTWLGRVRIVAEKDEIEREVILNPRTGEVLRDYSRHEDGSLRLPLGFEVELFDDDDEDHDEDEDQYEADEDGDDEEEGGDSDEDGDSDDDGAG